MRGRLSYVSSGVGALWAALDATDLDRLPDGPRLDELRALWPAFRAVQARLAQRVGDIDRRRAAGAHGAVSTRGFLRARLQLDAGAASTLVKAGAGLDELADTRAALAAGEISVEHGAVLADALVELGSAVMAGGVEKILIEYARGVAPSEL